MKEYYSVLEVVRRCAGRITWTARGLPLAEDDQSTLEFALVCWGCLLHDILPHDRALRTYCGFFNTKTCDTAVLVRTLKAYKEMLLSITKCAADECAQVVSRFKRERAGEIMYHGLISPVWPLFLSYAQDRDPHTFKLLFQWLSFLEHVNLRSLDLSSEGELAYVQFEREMCGWTYDSGDVRLMSTILTKWLSEFDLEGFHPSFGPGAVAEHKGRLGTRIKTSLLASDILLEYFTSRLPTSASFLNRSECRVSRTNDIVFVPKSMDKNRIISKEPAALGYFQHGLQAALYEYAYSHAFLRDRIDFRDQTRSRELARYGSWSGEYATLDLSNASDSVTISLIKRVVKNPSLRRGLIATRSTRARLPSGACVGLEKFAPMGSAVCFPIETLVFAVICEMACWLEEGRESRTNEYVVYGDDIVVRTKWVPCILQLLDRFHFTVNASKSYWYTGPVPLFREACGGFYVNGIDVSPVRISRRLSISRQPTRNAVPSVREALTDLANVAYLANFRTLRFGILSYLKEAYPGFRGIAFCDLDYPGQDRIVTDYGCDSNWNLRSRPDRCDPSTTSVKCLHTSSEIDLALSSHYPDAWEDDTSVYALWLCDRRALTYEYANSESIFRRDYGVEIAPERVQLDPCRSRERWFWAPLRK